MLLNKNNKKGFTLVELMVVIAILAAIAIPAYSNHILKTRLQDEINKMDNYRKAIAVFIQESGVTSNEEFQTDIANVKDNYLGDANVAIMSELKQNNGRLLAHPVINGTTYQIAITPRIGDGVVNWECNIRNETDNSAPPASAMPGGCTSTNLDLNDDQEAYNEQYDSLVNTRTTAINSAVQDYMTDLASERANDSIYQDLLDDQETANAALSSAETNRTTALNSLDSFFDASDDIDNLADNYTTALGELQSNGGALSSDSTQEDFDNAGLAQLETYRDTFAEGSSNYNAVDQLVQNRNANISNLQTAKTNYDNAVNAISTQQTLLNGDGTPDNRGINANIQTRKDIHEANAQASSDQVNRINTAHADFNSSLNDLNSSDDFSGGHVETRSS